jgi:hypothetical protein
MSPANGGAGVGRWTRDCTHDLFRHYSTCQREYPIGSGIAFDNSYESFPIGDPWSVRGMGRLEGEMGLPLYMAWRRALYALLRGEAAEHRTEPQTFMFR